MALSCKLYVLLVALLVSLAVVEGANLSSLTKGLLIRKSSASSTNLLNDQKDFSEFTSKRETIPRELSEGGEEEGGEHDHDDEHHDDSNKPWGAVLGATLIVNFATLTGVIFLIHCFT